MDIVRDTLGKKLYTDPSYGNRDECEVAQVQLGITACILGVFGTDPWAKARHQAHLVHTVGSQVSALAMPGRTIVWHAEARVEVSV